LREVQVPSAMAGLLFLAAVSAHAECVRVSPKIAVEGPGSELVFSGKVVQITRTAELGYRATFDVDRVWLGSVSKRFDIYVWELAPEAPRFEMAGTYVAIARRVDESTGEKVGLGGTNVVAFTPVQCSAGHSVSEFIRELGSGRPPNEPLDAQKGADAYVVRGGASTTRVPSLESGSGSGKGRELGPLQSARPAQPAADFALRFDHKGCHFEYLDTFKGTYSHVGSHPPVPFTLSDEQRDTLFSAVMAASFFDRPADLGIGKAASNNYELEVRNAGRRHTVKWTLESKWFQSEDGRPLRMLQDAIFKVLENHPDVLRLPRRGDGCSAGPPSIR
jgi:hypothetical protein